MPGKDAEAGSRGGKPSDTFAAGVTPKSLDCDSAKKKGML